LHQSARARVVLEQALERFLAGGMKRGTAWALTHLAEVAQVDGDRRRAFELHLRALGVYRELENAWGAVEELAELAALVAESGRYEAAARFFGAVERMRETTGIAAQNRLSDPHRVAAELRGRLSEQAFAGAWAAGRSLSTDQAAAEAGAIAAELADADCPPASPPGRPSLPAGLTEREVEVLRLVAQGLTNPQVAEQLYLSPRTIDAHLQRIYTKLDVPNRGAAIRFAVQHGLT
jgi:DNA-binding CsgD family transcriptional regulator